MIPWIRKYIPETSKDIVGQEKAVKIIQDFIKNYNQQENKKKKWKKNLLLYGPSGTGKTTSVYAIANDLNLEVFEINASDVRNKEQINTKLGAVLGQTSLFFKGKIILVDEIDGLSGRKDRGGLGALIKLIQKSSFPVMLTAMDPWNNKLSSLRNKCELVEFEHLNHKYIFMYLKKIAESENITYQENILKALARRTGGDLRSAINDFQTLTTDKELKKESLDELEQRSQTESIPNALIKVLKNSDPIIARDAFENVNKDLNEIMLWLDENIPKEYTKPQDLARAYDKLSKADVFKRRIRRWQHWRFLVYINALLTSGVSVSKDEKYKHFVKYTQTGRLLKLYWAKIRYMKRKSIAEKLAKHTHSSIKDCIKEIPYFQFTFKNNKQMAKEISEELDLNKEEIDWLKN